MRPGRLYYLPFICLGLVYLLFPTQNANIDSWYYAASTKYGQSLIHSHHLIYNLIGRYWYLLLRIFNPEIEALSALNIMNALAATGSLFICYRIFLHLHIEKKTALWLTVIHGSCFGLMRYATDAETYILPLLCSLASTYYFLRDKLLPSALFAILAILIHELHLCWALAMCIALLLRRPFNAKSFLLFTTPFLAVPVAYYIAYCSLQTDISFWSFIVGEYARGNAGLDLSLISLMLTGINFIRSFIQVHGQILYIIRASPILAILPIFIFLSAFIYLVIKKRVRVQPATINNPLIRSQGRLFLLAFLLHLIFALLSSGNAEFMVMLPFLLMAFLYSRCTPVPSGLLPFLAIFIFTWNYCMAVLPNYKYDIIRADKQVEWTSKHPRAYFLWHHKPLVENILTYKEGFDKRYNFIRQDRSTQYVIDSLVGNKIPVYTDYTNQTTSFSREEIIAGKGYIHEKNYLIPVAEWNNLYGHNEINLISKKGD